MPFWRGCLSVVHPSVTCTHKTRQGRDIPPPPCEHPSNRLLVLRRNAWKSVAVLQVKSPTVSTVRVKPRIGGWVLEHEQADCPAVVSGRLDDAVK